MHFPSLLLWRRGGPSKLLMAVLLVGCGDAPEASEPAVAIDHAVSEDQLTTVRLSMDAVRRLGIATVPVDSLSVVPTRTTGGEVVVPPGQSLTVSAPVSGTILAPAGGRLPLPGARVGDGEPLLRLVALPPDRDMGRVQQEVRTSEAQLRQARQEVERLRPLHDDQIVSARQYEAAEAAFEAAEAAYDGAVAQRNLLGNSASGDLRGLTPLLIVAPSSGVVRTLAVAAGQTVAAGTPLVEILGTNRLWIRVPVYAGDAARFNRGAEATVHGLAGASTGTSLRAVPVAAPPSANAASSSVDLFYELVNGSGSLSPGERVGITLPMFAPAERALVVPLAALVRDMNGGSWVYERTDSVTFVRRRVEAVRVVGEQVVLSEGPPPGTQVVTAGAAELFGSEFGSAGH